MPTPEDLKSSLSRLVPGEVIFIANNEGYIDVECNTKDAEHPKYGDGGFLVRLTLCRDGKVYPSLAFIDMDGNRPLETSRQSGTLENAIQWLGDELKSLGAA